MAIFSGEGRRRRQKRRMKRGARRGSRQEARGVRRSARQGARQTRKQTRTELRNTAEAIAGRQALFGQLGSQALEIGGQIAGGLTGVDVATAAYEGVPVEDFQTDIYYDDEYEDEEDGLKPWMIGAIAIVVVGGVALAMRK